jgi:UTP--glucose-1-phosphate uridylyltransferase
MAGGAGRAVHGDDSQFAPVAAKMRAAGVPQASIDNFRFYFNQLREGHTGLIPEADIEPVACVPDICDLGGEIAAGAAHLSQVAVLKLNGGLGTSMGLDRAKSLLPVRDGLSFLDIIARQTLAFWRRHGVHVPLLLLNSFSTDADTRAVLARYPDLAGELPLTLLQSRAPKVLRDTLAPVNWPDDPELEWYPPGHGEVYTVLETSGMLDALLDRGYRFLFLSNVDNLGATLDLRILGYMARREAPFLMEVADRTDADRKGGHLARRQDGQLILREVAQCPPGDMPAFQDIQRHRFFNTNNLWMSLPHLKQALRERNNVLELPMICNAKTVDPTQPDSPAVYQLETAMGAAIAIFPGAEALRVERDRFLPVKLCSDLLGLRSDAYVLDDDYRLSLHPSRDGRPLMIALDLDYYKILSAFEARFPGGPPSLVGCTSLSVQGDVLFEAGVVVRGDVQVINTTATQRRVPAGTILESGRLDLI